MNRLLERLKIQGNFQISPTEIMQVQRLLQERMELLLSPEGRQKLKLLLAPLLCRNEEEQQQFYIIYQEYLEKDLQFSQAEIKEQQAKAKVEKAQKVPDSWWEKWLPLFAGILFGLGTLSALIYRWQNPPKLNVSFEKIQKEARVGDTLRIKNLSDTSKVLFHWHCLDVESGQKEHEHKEYHLEWPIQDPGANHKKKIKLHGHHPALDLSASDSTEITILCNTLQVGSISVPDTIFRPNRPLPFSVVVGSNENLKYEWQFEGNDSIFREVAPIHTFPNNGNFKVSVVVTDTINKEGLCTKTVETTIKIDPEKPNNPIALATFDLLEEPPRVEHPLQPWYWPILALLFSVASWCWWKWRNRPDPNQLAIDATNLALKNRFATHDKNPYSIPFGSMDGNIQAHKSQFDIANSLRNRQRGTHQLMDIPATLTATIESGGFPNLQYRYKTKPTDYLVLIDWQSADSHLARLFQYLATMLQEQDVLLDIFYYQQDFEKFWNQRHPKGVDLAQLHRLYPQQRLLIFGDGHALVNQASENSLLQPNWERQLRKWSIRILLTSLPIVSWTYIEARLYRLFALFPGDLRGIIQAVRFLEADAAEEDLPSTLREWEEQLKKSQIEEDVNRKWRTLPHHEKYLEDHPEVLRWLKALVVYPNPTWNVTIAIGKALGVPVTYDNLMLLARIPWMQDGEFKTRLWRSIWPELSKSDEKIARQAVKTELEAVRRQTANAFAGQQLEQELAVQNFALAPTNTENQEIIQFLKEEDLIPNIHVEELDKVIERHVPKHRTGEEMGQTIEHYLDDAKKERSKEIKKPVRTTHFWWALALSLLSLLMSVGLLVDGDKWHRQSIEFPVSEAARLNNLAVEYSLANIPINLNELAAEYDTLSINGYNYKSTAALNILNKAIKLDSTFEKAHHNFQKQWYNDGISHYNQYLRDKTYEVAPAKNFLSRAIDYQGITIDSVSHAARYALANIHHILEEQDSVCLLLDTLLKVPDVLFFNAIPNLSSEAGYCINEEINFPINGRLQGVVYDRISKKPVPKVVVNYLNQKTITDQYGRYSFSINPNLVENLIRRGPNTYSGELKLSFSKDGYKNRNRYFSVAIVDSIVNVLERTFFEKDSPPETEDPQVVNPPNPTSSEEVESIVQNDPLLVPNPVFERVLKNVHDYQQLPNGQFAAISDEYISIVALIGEKTNSIIRSWKSKSGNVIAVSPDGQFIVSNDVGSNNAYVWEVNTGGLVKVLKGLNSPIWALDYSIDGKEHLISAGDKEGNSFYWNQAGEQIYTFKNHTGPINAIKGIFTAGADKKVNVVERASNGNRIPNTIGSHDGEVLTLIINQSEDILSAGEDKVAKYWKSLGEEPLILKGHNQPILEAAFSSNDALIATADFKGVIKIWQAADGKEIQSINLDPLNSSSLGSASRITGLFFSDNNQSLVVAENGALKKHKIVVPFGDDVINSTPIVDLSPLCPEVGNSGTQASTVGWSVGYSAMTMEYAKLIGWTDKTQITNAAFSPMFIYNQIKMGKDCNGGARLEDALDLVKNKGVCRLSSFYPEDCYAYPNEAMLEEANAFKISSYRRVWSNFDESADKAKLAKAILDTGKPVIIGFAPPNSFAAVKSGANYWIPDAKESKPNSSTSLVVVGYNDNAIKVVNHWGKDWGNQGFIWIRNEDFNKYALDGYVIELGSDFGDNNTIETGTFTDARDGQTYKWVRLKDGKKWMAENLNYVIADSSWCYENDPYNCEEYGRLYTWGVAMQACPKGWRLPTDDEWWTMAEFYGKAHNEYERQPMNTASKSGEAAYQALIQGGDSRFSALLGGYRYSDGDFFDLGNRGYYWSLTEYDASSAWRYSFRSTNKTLYRNGDLKSWARSCRCLQD